jgi:hypothetical protein
LRECVVDVMARACNAVFKELGPRAPREYTTAVYCVKPLWDFVFRQLFIEAGWVASDNDKKLRTSSIDVVHTHIAEINLSRSVERAGSTSYVEVHVTANYPMSVFYNSQHLCFHFFIQVWNAEYVAQHNFENDGKEVSDRSNFFDFE